jgi:hypothetical protein
MSAFDYLGATLIVINTALFLVVFASVPMSVKRGVGVAPSFIYLLTTAATVVWMWRALQWQA